MRLVISTSKCNCAISLRRSEMFIEITRSQPSLAP